MKKYFISTITAVIFLFNTIVAQKATGVDRICITVKDLNRSIEFYTKVLPFQLTGTEEFYGTEYETLLGKFGIRFKVAHLKLGNEQIDLIDYLTSGGRSVPETQKSNDLNFQHIAIVVSDMEKAFAQLQKNHVEFVSTAPQTLPLSNKAAAGIKAFYFHDNDNHNLELIYFPKGKGNPKWQQSNGKIFLGIDHTAIGISNTSTSSSFWIQTIGFEKKGESHNVGTEQAHLNNVKDAELHITGTSAGKGPGVEFLEYVKPGAGEPYPANTQCDDLWNWITIVQCDDAEGLYKKLKESKTGTMVSDEVVTIQNKKQFIIRDTDGHAVWFIQK